MLYLTKENLTHFTWSLSYYCRHQIRIHCKDTIKFVCKYSQKNNVTIHLRQLATVVHHTSVHTSSFKYSICLQTMKTTMVVFFTSIYVATHQYLHTSLNMGAYQPKT